MIVGAVDPGIKGGLAVVSDATFEWRPMPILKVKMGKKGTTNSWIDSQLVEIFYEKRPLSHFILELQQAMPQQGLVSTMTIGSNFGPLRHLALKMHRAGTTVIVVRPTVWKSELGLSSVKTEATDLCRDLFGKNAPSADGPAEALLLAYWWHRRTKTDGSNASQGLLFEPRPIRTKQAFLAGPDASRSGVVDVRHSTPLRRRAGRLFAVGAGDDGSQVVAGRRGGSP